MQGLLAAVAHLHSQGVVHRDVKPENMLMDHTQAVKLSGFSCGRLMIAGLQLWCRHNCLTSAVARVHVTGLSCG